MTKGRLHSAIARTAGLVVGPALWALNTQAGQILPYVDCRSSVRSAAILSLILAVVSLGSGWVSRRSATGQPDGSSGFLAMLGATTALIFAFALVLQGAAGLILTGCER